MKAFLSPVSDRVSQFRSQLPAQSLGAQIRIHVPGEFPEVAGAAFALLGIKENRGNIPDEKERISYDSCRMALYSLFPGNWDHLLVDLGDIEPGETLRDSRFALKQVVAELISRDVIPLILGAGQDLAYDQYRAYDDLGKMINFVNIDSCFDLGNSELPLSAKSYVARMIVDKPYNLYNYSVLGYQSYYNPPEEISLMEKLYFDAYRLGEITADLTLSEPCLRDADMVTLDIMAIKGAEICYKNNTNPNGLDGREVCALSRYAGISNRVSSFGVYGLGDPDLSPAGSMLVAQVLWYFMEGVNFRIDDGDFENESLFKTYIVPVDDLNLVFKKSNKTDRWWIELPKKSKADTKLKKPALLPCTYAEYLGAINQEVPERWLKARLKNES